MPLSVEISYFMVILFYCYCSRGRLTNQGTNLGKLMLPFLIGQDKPYLNFKAKTCPQGKVCGSKRTVIYEIHHGAIDRWGNHYPDKSKCCTIVSTAAHLSRLLTSNVIDKNIRSSVPLESYKDQLRLSGVLLVATLKIKSRKGTGSTLFLHCL